MLVKVLYGSSEILTGNAGEELTSELLDVTAGEWHKIVQLEKVKNTLAKQICDDADVVPEVEGVS